MSIRLNIADVQYAYNDMRHKDVTSIAFIRRDEIRTHYTATALWTDVELFPLARCGFSTHVAQRPHTCVVDNDH